jgi:uncharacterized membrane protein YheB (UPF0754 family)
MSLLDDLARNWMLYASMPLAAALIGYVTKILAIEMMFRPIEFVGIKPWLGWQGIVPRKAATMAAISCDMLTAKLIKPEDIFRKLDPHRVAREIEEPLLEAVEEITREVAERFQPGLWHSLPLAIRGTVIQRIQAESPAVIAQIMQEIQRNVDRVFDLKDMVVTNLVKDKPLLNRIFLEAGHGEFRFIRNSGIYFGLAIGVVQAVTWALTHSPWVMPLFGGFTGWFTDWLALKMVFEPKHPRRYLGLFTWQGLFIKRRKEVAAAYGRLIAREILTPSRILDAILRGPLSDKLFVMVQRVVQRTIDEQAGLALPIVVLAIGSTRYQEMKRVIADKVVERLPATMSHVERYAADAMDIENTLVAKMQELSPEEFEGLLRPVFRQDEWILITVGAVLGFLVGEMQVQIMLRLGGVG